MEAWAGPWSCRDLASVGVGHGGTVKASLCAEGVEELGELVQSARVELGARSQGSVALNCRGCGAAGTGCSRIDDAGSQVIPAISKTFYAIYDGPASDSVSRAPDGSTTPVPITGREHSGIPAYGPEAGRARTCPVV